jgi:hypothetical protein
MAAGSEFVIEREFRDEHASKTALKRLSFDAASGGS